MTKGRIVSELPSPRRDYVYNWDASALLAQQHPGSVVCAAERVPESKVKSLRMYRRAPFRQADGHIQINVRESHVEEDGIRYGNVYMVWVPATQEG